MFWLVLEWNWKMMKPTKLDENEVRRDNQFLNCAMISLIELETGYRQLFLKTNKFF
jgi:hypothetical protein